MKDQELRVLIARATHAYAVWNDSRVWESRMESTEARRGREDAQARIAATVLQALRSAAREIARRMHKRGVNFRNARPYAVGSVLGVKVYRCLHVTTPRAEFIGALRKVVRRACGADDEYIVNRLAHEVEAELWPNIFSRYADSLASDAKRAP